MALSYVRDVVSSRPDQGHMITDITLDTAYPAGGYPLSNAALGMLLTPTHVECSSMYSHGTATLSMLAIWDKTNNKLKIFKSNTAAAPTEAASADITASHSVRVKATGKPVC
jgi:hypothetical protein